MMRTPPALLAVSLAGCVTVPAAPTLDDARPFTVVAEKTALYEFHVQWPVGADRTPGLGTMLRARALAAKAEAFNDVEADKAFRDKEGYPFHPYSYRGEWSEAGSSPRLVSLLYKFSVFTGGAHPNSASKGLLWDRARQAETSLQDLFSSPAALAATLGPGWCTAIDAERGRRRVGAPMGGDFDQCPRENEVTIAPLDRDRDGRFDRIVVIADPYVAGPYSEGEYRVELAVSAPLIAALRPEWRAEFEPGA